MAPTNNLTEKSKEPVFTISRTFDAPRELVWKVWTDTEHLKHWWGPKGAEILDAKLDLRPGGIFHYRMRYAGRDIWGKFVFREIKPFEKMVWVNSFSDEKAGVTRHPFGPTWPLEMLTTLTFTEEKGKTTLTIHWTPLSPTEIERKTFEAGHGSMRQGWTGTFDQLTDYLAKKSGVKSEPFVIERTFNAPVQKVWKAITDKDQMKQWYFDLPEFKPEVGAEFKFLGGKPCEKSYLHLCKVTEVVPGKKLTYSWRYDGYEGNSFVTFELFAEGSQTRLKLTHAGLETFPKSNPDLAKKNFAEGWTHILGASLKQFLE